MTSGCKERKCKFYKNSRCTDDDSQYSGRCRYNTPEEQQGETEATGMLKWEVQVWRAAHNDIAFLITVTNSGNYDLHVWENKEDWKNLSEWVDIPTLEAAQQKAEEILKEMEG